MQEKVTLETFELFEKLPLEVQVEASSHLSTLDLVHLASASRTHWTLFKPLVNARKLSHYLHLVARSEYDAVQAMLQNDMSLLLQRGCVTDCYGRIFACISGFEYAMWALDEHMWAMMLENIPQNEKGKAVLTKLFAQYEQLNAHGITYRLNGEEITEKHFDFENTIIKELRLQVDSINAPVTKNWVAIDKQWREGVGSAQKKLPMHVIHEYCSKVAFYPLPSFVCRPQPLKEFYNETTKKTEHWFAPASKLGTDFAIYKGAGKRSYSKHYIRAAGIDLDAMVSLYAVKANKFINLGLQLERQMSIDNQLKIGF